MANMAPRRNPLGAKNDTDLKSRRERKSHAKVKTGCLTCKIRHKKCDETRPACRHCTSTGRKCDGFPLSDQFIAYEAPVARAQSADNKSPDAFIGCNNLQGPRLIIEPGADRPAYGFRQRRIACAPAPEAVHPSPVPGMLSIQDGHHIGGLGIGLRPTPLSNLMAQSTLSSYPVAHCDRLPSSTTWNDLDCFGYFASYTAPIFSSYFDGSTWFSLATMLGHGHTEVFYAAAACGAAHRQFMAGISSEAFQFYRRSRTLYQQALKSMKHASCDQQSSAYVPLMISQLLLAVFACFQDDMANAVVHLRAGMASSLSRRTKLLHSEERCSLNELSPISFRTQMQHLRLEAYKLLNDRVQPNRPYPLGQTRHIPDVFIDLRQARNILFAEVDTIFSVLECSEIDESRRRKIQTECVTRMFQWNAAFARTIQTKQDLEMANPRVCKVLRTTQNALYLLVYLVLFDCRDLNGSLVGLDHRTNTKVGRTTSSTQQKTSRSSVEGVDDRGINFARIAGLVESLASLDNSLSPEEHKISLDSAIGPPREPCPAGVNTSSKTRHLIKSLLSPSDSKEALWKMLDVYTIAERLSAVEEYAVISVIDKVVQPVVFPRWSSITHMFESSKLLLRYCQPGDSGGETRWIEELWALER